MYLCTTVYVRHMWKPMHTSNIYTLYGILMFIYILLKGTLLLSLVGFVFGMACKALTGRKSWIFNSEHHRRHRRQAELSQQNAVWRRIAHAHLKGNKKQKNEIGGKQKQKNGPINFLVQWRRLKVLESFRAATARRRRRRRLLKVCKQDKRSFKTF